MKIEDLTKQEKNNLKYIVEYLSQHHNPKGKYDKGRRWYPYEEETCTCCSGIRSPSRAFPYSLYKHCSSKKHLKQLALEKKEFIEALNLSLEEAMSHVGEKNLIGYLSEQLLLRSNPQDKSIERGK